jgi:phenylalanine-4-hydroxylase
MAEPLPKHLLKYVVEQNYEQYTPVDHACWRYIMRQLKSFLSVNAHPSYLEGLEKTGISIDRIPRISEVSEKLALFGWKAIPVSGFIPPAAFMELQSLGYLPIASAMRSLDHLLYTPAPDIVHEAAGHAPILVQPDFAQYLKEYAQVAKKAIISSEDLAVYEAIRHLSDIKEDPSSTQEQIDLAQVELERVSKAVTHISEAAELGRMNWWTAEYGLIGDLESPKIFGAGLLSSVGESKWCLSQNVKKIPLSIECIKQNYDITEPQPQLFVARDFKQLTSVLHQMANQMAFKIGGVEGITKAIQAKSVNTIELDSGLQISGVCERLISTAAIEIAYLNFRGPTQLCYLDKEIPGQGKEHHTHGFGSAFGPLTGTTWEKVIQKVGENLELVFQSGVQLKGQLKYCTQINGRILIVTFEKCTVKYNDEILFQPDWGLYDLAIGSKVISVFGGPADRDKYGDLTDFVALRVSAKKYSELEQKKFKNYASLRELRESRLVGTSLVARLKMLIDEHAEFNQDWLFFLECYELAATRASHSDLVAKLQTQIKSLQTTDDKTKNLIDDGLRLALQI